MPAIPMKNRAADLSDATRIDGGDHVRRGRAAHDRLVAKRGKEIPRSGHARVESSGQARLWFGGQGWLYKDWVGTFYPPGTDGLTMLAEYGRVFNTVEVDSSYYATPDARTVEGWRKRSPEGFRFSLKVPSEVTHVRRFRDAEPQFDEFVERVRLLGPKLGAILVQCPPDFDPSEENREALFGFIRSQIPSDMPVALELRDERWYDDALFGLAREKAIALAATEGMHSSMDLAARIVEETVARPPTDFAYIRWLGDRSLTKYDRVQLERTSSLDGWERLIRALRRSVRDIYGYANNHYQGHSPATIRAVLARLGEPVPPETTTPRLL